MTILDEIAEKTRERIDSERAAIPLASVRYAAEEALRTDPARNDGTPLFEQALSSPDFSFICEVKKASPSKGVIAEEFDPLAIAMEYDRAGADAISCLTEPYWFLGSDEYLEEIARAVSIPVLRKDFTVDEYMVYQAKALGASAVLLICAILDDRQLLSYRQLAEELCMSALVEAHDEDEIERALACGARIIGVNNRNLKDFTVDLSNAGNLRDRVPEDVIFISESGVKAPEDVRKMAEYGADAALIGEALMRSADKSRLLDEMREAASKGMASR